MKPWTELLSQSQVAYMNDIISQVPETLGARDVFVKCLQDLADKQESKSTFQFYIVDLAMGEVRGTNDEEIADNISDSDEHFVIDTHANEWVTADGNQEILEAE